eukprot:5027475-Prymnesium_polylepis.2
MGHLADVPPVQRVGAHLRGGGDGRSRASPPAAGRQAGKNATVLHGGGRAVPARKRVEALRRVDGARGRGAWLGARRLQEIL